MNIFEFRSTPLFSRQSLLCMPLIGIGIGFMGPFESYGTMGVAARAGHFSLCVTAIGAMVMAASYYIARQFFLGYWPLWAALCVDFVLSVPGTAIVFASLAIFASSSVGEAQTLDLFWQNLLMILSFRAGSLLVSWRQVRDGEQIRTSLKMRTASDELIARLPYGLRGERILALSSEDHYLRVHTLCGEALIHLALSNAISMLGDGFQIHRSHWIAREGIKSTSAVSVQLVTGLALPISRHRAKKFRIWLDRKLQ